MSLIVNEGKNRSVDLMSNGVGPLLSRSVFSSISLFDGKKQIILIIYRTFSFVAWIRNIQNEKLEMEHIGVRASLVFKI